MQWLLHSVRVVVPCGVASVRQCRFMLLAEHPCIGAEVPLHASLRQCRCVSVGCAACLDHPIWFSSGACFFRLRHRPLHPHTGFVPMDHPPELPLPPPLDPWDLFMVLAWSPEHGPPPRCGIGLPVPAEVATAPQDPVGGWVKCGIGFGLCQVAVDGSDSELRIGILGNGCAPDHLGAPNTCVCLVIPGPPGMHSAFVFRVCGGDACRLIQLQCPLVLGLISFLPCCRPGFTTGAPGRCWHQHRHSAGFRFCCCGGADPASSAWCQLVLAACSMLWLHTCSCGHELRHRFVFDMFLISISDFVLPCMFGIAGMF